MKTATKLLALALALGSVAMVGPSALAAERDRHGDRADEQDRDAPEDARRREEEPKEKPIVCDDPDDDGRYGDDEDTQARAPGDGEPPDIDRCVEPETM